MCGKNILSQLPEIEFCRRIFRAIAMLDAIIMPEWENRYYSFNSNWGKDEMMASMRDGSGEHYFALFNEYGLIIKGYEKAMISDSKINKKIFDGKKIFSSVPAEFEEFLKDPAFIIGDSTFCIWNLNSQKVWNSGKEYNPNELYLLNVLIKGVEYYKSWAEEYYEIEIPINIVKYIFNFQPLNKDIVSSLNSTLTINDLYEDIIEIGYPCT